MKTVFIVNLFAGKGNEAEKIAQTAQKACEENGIEFEIYYTKSVGDGKRFVREYCEKYGVARIIACGGDGTFGEILNGAIGFSGVELGIIPCGTGNDFCRNFGEKTDFRDIHKVLDGKTVKCDAVKYTVYSENGITERYCANMFNIGFDCNVADMTAEMKKKPFISGSLAYFLSIFVMLVKKKGANLEIVLDGELKHKGKLLLTSLANGSFCGGGVKSNPLASITDGNMDVNIVNNISRINFISKLPFYMKGTHIKLKNIEKVIAMYKCRKAVITPLDGVMKLCVDGEIYSAGKTEFEIHHGAFNFVVPDCKKSGAFTDSAENVNV